MPHIAPLSWLLLVLGGWGLVFSYLLCVFFKSKR